MFFFFTVEYAKGEDPKLIITGKYEQTAGQALIALSPNAEVVAIATGSSVAFYATSTAKLDYTIENVYSGEFIF